MNKVLVFMETKDVTHIRELVLATGGIVARENTAPEERVCALAEEEV